MNRWRRVLIAFGVETHPGLTATTAAEAEANAAKFSSALWPQIATALTALHTPDPPQDPPQQQDQSQDKVIFASDPDRGVEIGGKLRVDIVPA